jgi:hypothetical protein
MSNSKEDNVSSYEVAEAFTGPAVLINRFLISKSEGGYRLSMMEVHPNNHGLRLARGSFFLTKDAVKSLAELLVKAYRQ